MSRFKPEDLCALNFTTGWDGPHSWKAKCEGAYLWAWYRSDTARFHISDIRVLPSRRRQGIGKQLLRLAHDEASAVGAEHITANIISRECLDAMRAVFGRAALTVMREGKYADEFLTGFGRLSNKTYAELNFCVPNTVEQTSISNEETV